MSLIPFDLVRAVTYDSLDNLVRACSRLTWSESGGIKSEVLWFFPFQRPSRSKCGRSYHSCLVGEGGGVCLN